MSCMTREPTRVRVNAYERFQYFPSRDYTPRTRANIGATELILNTLSPGSHYKLRYPDTPDSLSERLRYDNVVGRPSAAILM